MRPPYSTEEVASAIMAAAEQRGLTLERVNVEADTSARFWRLEAVSHDGTGMRATCHFSQPAGILTPAELADRLLEGPRP